MYVCHSNSFILPPLNSKHNDTAINSGCSTHTWPLNAPVHNFQKTASSAAINVKLPKDQVMAQSHHGTMPISDMLSSAQHVKNLPGSFLQTSSFFRTTSRRRLQIPGRQQLHDPNPSLPSKFNFNQMSVFGHVPIIFTQPAFCPAVPHVS